MNEIVKFQLGTAKSGSDMHREGGVWVYDAEAQLIASSVYLHANTSYRYFLVSNDHQSPPVEFQVVRWLDEGDKWTESLPPYLYQIKLL